jgi:adenosylcobyric acid synthase
VSYLDHGLDEEDRPLRLPLNTRAPADMLRVGALLSPAVANTEDLAPLLAEPDVHLTWITDPRLVSEQDLLVLPASKATVADLVRHTASGMALAVSEAYAAGCWILGLCGGYQMLGEHLEDAGGTEGGPKTWPGLGLLPIDTIFESEKRTRQHHCVSAWPLSGRPLAGYEIHHGQTRSTGRSEPLFVDAGAELGCRRDRAVGCYLHGLLADDEWRAAFLNVVREDRGRAPEPVRIADPVDLRLDRWARHLRRSFRGDAWSRLLSHVTK